MNAASDRKTIGTVLVARRYEILEAFVQRVRRLELAKRSVSATDIARPFAACLTWMSRSLGEMTIPATQCAALAHEYADDRKRLGYELPAMLTELGLFRAALAEAAAETGVDVREADRAFVLFHRFLSDVVARAAGSSAATSRTMSALRRSRG